MSQNPRDPQSPISDIVTHETMLARYADLGPHPNRPDPFPANPTPPTTVVTERRRHQGSSAEEEIRELVGEDVRVDGQLTEDAEISRLACPKTDYGLPLHSFEFRGNAIDTLGISQGQLIGDIKVMGEEEGVPLTYGGNFMTIQLVHRRPSVRQTFDDLTVLIVTAYHQNWPNLMKRLRTAYRGDDKYINRPIQIEILNLTASFEWYLLPLSHARLIHDWNHELLDTISALVRRRGLLYNAIESFDMKYISRNPHYDVDHGGKKHMIQVTIPVGRWHREWNSVRNEIRDQLKRKEDEDGHQEYDKIMVEIVQGGLERSAVNPDHSRYVMPLRYGDANYGALHMGQWIGVQAPKGDRHSAAGTLGPIFELWTTDAIPQKRCLVALTSFHVVDDAWPQGVISEEALKDIKENGFGLDHPMSGKHIMTSPSRKGHEVTQEELECQSAKYLSDQAAKIKQRDQHMKAHRPDLAATQDVQARTYGQAAVVMDRYLSEHAQQWADTAEGYLGEVVLGSGHHWDNRFVDRNGKKLGRIDYALIKLPESGAKARLPDTRVQHINQFPPWEQCNVPRQYPYKNFLPAMRYSTFPDYLHDALTADIQSGPTNAFKKGARTGYTWAVRNTTYSELRYDEEPASFKGSHEIAWLGPRDRPFGDKGDSGAGIWDEFGNWIGLTFAGKRDAPQHIVFGIPATFLLHDLRERFGLQLKYPYAPSGEFLQPEEPFEVEPDPTVASGCDLPPAQ